MTPPMEKTREPREGHVPQTMIALIDASNVAHSTEGDQVRLDNIRIVRDKLIEEG